MKIIVNNNEIEFHEKTQDNSSVWETTVHLREYELDFMLDSSLLPSDFQIDWNVVGNFVKYVLDEIDEIQNKGSKALERQYGTIDFFEAAGVELLDFHNDTFQFKIFYLLQPKLHMLVNTGLLHYAYFSSNNGLSLEKVMRE